MVALVNTQDLALLDRVFSLLAFCFKYLVRPIRENFTHVYSLFSELVHVRNSWVRRFSAQSLSYVLRKLTFDQALIEMLGTADEHALGVAELLYEVVQGAQALHSKTA